MASCSRKRYLLKIMSLLYLSISPVIDETWHGLPSDVTNRSWQVTPQILVLDILKLYVNSSIRRRNPRPSNSASPVAWKWVEVVFMIITAFRSEPRDQRPQIRTVKHRLSRPPPLPTFRAYDLLSHERLCSYLTYFYIGNRAASVHDIF